MGPKWTGRPRKPPFLGTPSVARLFFVVSIRSEAPKAPFRPQKPKNRTSNQRKWTLTDPKTENPTTNEHRWTRIWLSRPSKPSTAFCRPLTDPPRLLPTAHRPSPPPARPRRPIVGLPDDPFSAKILPPAKTHANVSAQTIQESRFSSRSGAPFLFVTRST